MKNLWITRIEAVAIGYDIDMEETFARGRQRQNVGIRDREFLAWLKQEHYLNYPLIPKAKIPDGYLQYWDDDDLCYRVAPAAEADRYSAIIKAYPKYRDSMEDETVVVPEVEATDETAETVVEPTTEELASEEEVVVEPEAV